MQHTVVLHFKQLELTAQSLAGQTYHQTFLGCICSSYLHKLDELAGRQVHAMAVHLLVVGKCFLPAVIVGGLRECFESAHHSLSSNWAVQHRLHTLYFIVLRDSCATKTL